MQPILLNGAIFLMRKFGAIILSLGLTTPASAADYLCDSFEVAFEFYRSNLALEEFDVAGGGT